MLRAWCAAILTVTLLLAGGFALSSGVIASSVVVAAGKAEPIDLNSATADRLEGASRHRGCLCQEIVEGRLYCGACFCSCEYF
jgi:hypothetical protein